MSLKAPLVKEKLFFKKSQDLKAFFNQSWEVFRPKGNILYVTHRNFRLFFLSSNETRLGSSLISAKKYFTKWVDSYNFLLNLFFLESNIQLLTNDNFIEESLTFNWHLNYKNYKLFRFIQPFFIFKDARHGAAVHSSIRSIFLQKLDYCIVADIKNHEKMLKYLKRYNLYMVGLVPVNYSPWQISYPIPTFSDSLVSQYYFLRWLFHLKGISDTTKYKSRTTVWLDSTYELPRS